MNKLLVRRHVVPFVRFNSSSSSSSAPPPKPPSPADPPRPSPPPPAASSAGPAAAEPSQPPPVGRQGATPAPPVDADKVRGVAVMGDDKKPAGSTAGLFAGVLASLMQNDVRAAYEMSLLPPERQPEFLAHLREMDAAKKKAEIERVREQAKADVELAHTRSKNTLEQMKQKRIDQEEAEAAAHARRMEELEKETEAALEMARSKWRYQKWRAVAEREKRLTLKRDEAKRSIEHRHLLERLAREEETRQKETDETLQIEEIRHKHSLEVEAMKASAAAERMKENKAALDLGPNEDIKMQQQHEAEMEAKRAEERQKQRDHDWELHKAQTEESELRAHRAHDASGSNELLWRCAQLGLGAVALAVVYVLDSQHTAQKAEAQRLAADQQAAKLKAEQDHRNQQLRLQKELEEAKRDAEIEVARRTSEAISLESNNKTLQAEMELEKAKLDLEISAQQAKEAEAQAISQEQRLKQVETLRTFCLVGGIFTVMLKVGGAFSS
ncbi:hypothetical protein DIPPA_30504 [Diplonema papillatum]|nr:hypothetical protein DIPPA_30504 [Diplonema papillatum]